MYCTNCGAELAENIVFCGHCGKRNKKRFTFKHVMLICMSIVAVVAIICKINVVNEIEVGEDGDQQLVENPLSNDISSEKINANKVGNSYANLGYLCSGFYLSEATGRVAEQDGVVYFYESGYIKRIDTDGRKENIIQTNEARSINVVGDTIFYLQNGSIYSVKTDGSNCEQLLKKVLGPFVVYDDAIYYVSSFNVSASVEEFFVGRYFINRNEPQETINTGEYVPTILGINEIYDAVIFCYQIENYKHPKYTALFYEQHRLVTANFANEIIHTKDYVAPDYNAECDLFAIIGQDNIYVIQYCNRDFDGDIVTTETMLLSDYTVLSNEMEGYYSPRNVYGDDLVIDKRMNDGTIALALASQENSGKNIVREKVGIAEVYIVGDYVYYAIGGYREAELYRVRIDGTGWEEL